MVKKIVQDGIIAALFMSKVLITICQLLDKVRAGKNQFDQFDNHYSVCQLHLHFEQENIFFYQQR